MDAVLSVFDVKQRLGGGNNMHLSFRFLGAGSGLAANRRSTGAAGGSSTEQRTISSSPVNTMHDERECGDEYYARDEAHFHNLSTTDSGILENLLPSHVGEAAELPLMSPCKLRAS